MESIGRFQVTGEVGRGGEGIVYSAFDPTIGRKVAIKALLVGADKASAALRARLRQEAMFSGKLSHPSIVTIHEFLEADNASYLVMEFVEGVTLADRMAEPATEAVIISLLSQIADALDYAHTEGVVHRDVKPANMIVTGRGQLKVTDFGIAKLLNDTIAGGQTQTGFVRGTAHYMSPEQIEQKGVSGQSDQFSLAVIAYQWLAGRKPFDGDSWTSLLYQILHVQPEGVNRPGQPVDQDVTDVLLKAMAKLPGQRYPTCREFIEDLEIALGVASSTAVFSSQVGRLPTTNRRRTTEHTLPPTPVNPPNAARSIWIGVALAVAIAVIGGGAAWWYLKPAPPGPIANDPNVTQPPVSRVAPAKPSEVKQEPVAKEPQVTPPVTTPKPNAKQNPIANKATQNKATQKPEPVKPEPVPVQVTTPPPVAEHPTPTGRYLGPPSGRFTWSGSLAAGQTLTVSVAGASNRPSTGTIEGRGIPYNLAVSISVQPPEIRVVQRPSAANGYQLLLRNASSTDVSTITVQWREEKE